MRLRKDPEAETKLSKYSCFVKSLPLKVEKSTVIELGMGKGEMLTKLAAKNPDINYVGIEKSATVALKAAKRFKELELTNAFIILADINDLDEMILGKIDLI
jgi:tRNA (guanine-N7-)-methyltransferase